MSSSFFFFNDTATTEIYTLSLHDALPIYRLPRLVCAQTDRANPLYRSFREGLDRKSTRLNSSHLVISYAVFCLKKKTEDACPLLGTLSEAMTLLLSARQNRL